MKNEKWRKKNEKGKIEELKKKGGELEIGGL